MTVVPGSIESRMMVNQCVGGSVRHGNKKWSAELSFNTARHPLTPNKVYFHRPNLLSISMVLLGPPLFWEQPSETPAWFPCRTCPSLRRYVYSSNIPFGFGGRVRGTRTWWVELPGEWDYSAVWTSTHLAPELWHRQRNPSRILGSADHVISRPQVLLCTLLQSHSTSFRNCMAIVWSLNRYARPPSSRNIRLPYENRHERCPPQAFFVHRNYFSTYVPPFYCSKKTNAIANLVFPHKQWLFRRYRMLQCGCYVKNAGTRLNGRNVSCWWKWKPEETERKWVILSHDCSDARVGERDWNHDCAA